MGLLSVLGLGKQAGDAIASPIEAIGNVLDKLFTSDEEKRAAEAVMEKLRQHPAELQIEVNKLEAQHRSWFVAGWRPYIGWVLGTALGMYYIPQYAIAAFIWAKICLASNAIVAFPIENLAGLIELVLAMLGMAGLRSIEKFNGKTK